MNTIALLVCASGALTPATSPLPSDPLVCVEQALAYGFVTSGAALQTAWLQAPDTINDTTLRTKFAVVAGEAAQYFSASSVILGNELDPSDPALLLFQPRLDATALTFDSLSTALYAVDYDSVQTQMGELSDQLDWYAKACEVLLDRGSVATQLRASASAARRAEAFYGLIAPGAGWSSTKQHLLDVVDASHFSTDMLLQLRNDAFAITDPNIINMAGFNDIDLAMAVWNIVPLVTSPAYQTWVSAMEDDLHHWAEELVVHGSTPSIVQAGDGLLSAGIELYTDSAITELLIPGCDSDCGPEGPACPGACALCESGIGVGSNNPDDCKDINALLDLLAELPGLIPTPAVIPAPLSHLFSFPTSADPHDVTDAMKALMATLKSRRPELWIKVCWPECVSHRCGWFWASTEYKCEEKKSEWINVPAPMDIGGAWPPLKSWSSGSMPAKIAAAADKAATTACAGH